MTAGTSMAKKEEKEVLRPLKVLIPLIKEELRKASEAAEAAARPYHENIGTLLSEARNQMSYSEYIGWTRRNFGIRETQAVRYLKIGRTTGIYTRARDSSMSDSLRELGTAPRGSERGGASWHEPVKDIINRVDIETLNLQRDALKRAEEREAERKLALQLIDIGYKALATKLHPDRGGSREAMSRLNHVRDRLKSHA